MTISTVLASRAVSVSKLLALGLLADEGPMHGYRICREAEDKNVEAWGGVSVGALYRDLHVMARDGLIAVERAEQEGRWPERTVYRITDAGRRELDVLRERAMSCVQHHPDPVGVALRFGSSADGPEVIREVLAGRRQKVAARLEELRDSRRHLAETDALDRRARIVFRRHELLLEAEMAWHDECDAQLDAETSS